MKSFRISFAIVLLALISLTSQNARAEEGKYRLGIQGSHFVSGLSGVMELSDPWAIQGVIDFGVDNFAVRCLNRFHTESNWNAYGLANLGVWDTGKDNEFGLGVGIGVEYDWRGLNSSLPPIGWNIELGAAIVPDFDFDFAFGIHWKF